MTLTQSQFNNLVKKLEVFARRYPQRYKFRVRVLAALGAAYIILLPLFFLSLAALLIVFGFSIPLEVSTGAINALVICFSLLPLAFAFLIFKALNVYFLKPKGLELNRQEAPKLFTILDEFIAKLNVKKLHHVFLTEEFNACVVQLPRPNLLAFQQNYLLLGLPLMQALSLEQFNAVLAHELGHLSSNHSRFAGRIYLIRLTWWQIWNRLSKSSYKGSTLILDIFLNWYAPFLNAYSFVLARANEYEADRCAVELVGKKNTAEALINFEIKNRFLETCFWKKIYKQIHHRSLTPNTVFTDMLIQLRNEVSIQDARLWLDQALAMTTRNEDTHPCLSARLSALNYFPVEQKKPVIPAPVTISAAQELMGNKLEQLAKHFDREWQRKTSVDWHQWHEDSKSLQMRLEFLEKQAQSQLLSLKKAWELVCLVSEYRGKEAAISRLYEVLTIQPDHPNANFTLGEILLQQNDSQGISYLEKAANIDFEYILPTCELLRSFFSLNGDVEKANQYQTKIENSYEIVLEAQDERAIVSVYDSFLPHDLPKPLLKKLSRQLSSYPQMCEAYLVRKVLKYFPECPLYVLAVSRRKPFMEDYRDERDQEFLDEVYSELEFPNKILLVLLNWHRWRLKQVLRKVPRSLIQLD